MKRHAFISMVLILATWLMTGFSVDDEFYNEYTIFLKHRPASQYYFKSPLGLADMPVDYSADKAVAYYTYRDFVLAKHWSSDLDWLAVFLVFTTVWWTGFVVVTYVRKTIKTNRA